MTRQEDATASAVDQALVKCAQLSLPSFSQSNPRRGATCQLTDSLYRYCILALTATGHLLRAVHACIIIRPTQSIRHQTFPRTVSARCWKYAMSSRIYRSAKWSYL